MTSDTALPVELDENGLEAAMVWFARNFNGAPDGRALTTGIVTAYLRALSPTRTTVKPLEWRPVEAQRSDSDPRSEETGDYEALTPFGAYYIEMGFGSDEYVWSLFFNGLPVDGVRGGNDPEKLKAAAQSHFAAGILSALTSTAKETE